jgi:DNA-binding NarL/FixJ family response regulator
VSVMEHALPHGQRDPEGLAPPAEDRVTVLTVDDQDYFRDVMCEVVGATNGFTVIAQAASGEEALAVAERLSPSLVIIDKRMPGIGGIEACRLLTERHPEIVVLVVSVEDPDAITAASCRAVAFLRKQDLSPRSLRELWLRHRPSG